jgi:hypothetical protein
MRAVWFIPVANSATTLICSHLGLANCLLTGDHRFADFVLALIHNVLHLQRGHPNLIRWPYLCRSSTYSQSIVGSVPQVLE